MSLFHYFWPNPQLDPPASATASVLSASSIRSSCSPVPNATGYQLYQQFDVNRFGPASPVLTGTTYDVTGLVAGTGYTFFWAAIGNNLPYTSSLASPLVSATPTASGVMLAAPANPQASAPSSTVLNVVASSVANATGYRLYQSATATGTYGAASPTLATPSYTLNALSPGTSYYFKWLAVGDGNAYLDSPQGVSFSGTTLAGTALPTITNFVASVPSETITITSFTATAQ